MIDCNDWLQQTRLHILFWFDIRVWWIFSGRNFNLGASCKTTISQTINSKSFQVLKRLFITEHDIFNLFKPTMCCFINFFLKIKKCSKPFLKIGFRDQTWVALIWNSTLVLCTKKCYCHANLHLLHSYLWVFGSSRQFPSVLGSFLQFPHCPIMLAHYQIILTHYPAETAETDF